ncbi:MAG: hypothetical protein DHS20C11_01120 [Lysobacteraceae bacterium]|nr:MAG: hypothetical protein DHS20C11_01120 [Xanthomonadaceae bacterium]
MLAFRSEAGIDVGSTPLRPPLDADIALSGVWADSCVPENLAKVNYRPNEIELVVGFHTSHYFACGFAFTPYSFDVQSLNIPAVAPIDSGTVVLRKEQLLHASMSESVQVEVSLPPAVSQFAYLITTNSDIAIYRVDDWTKVATIQTNYAERLFSNQNNYFMLTGETTPGTTSESLGYLDSDLNQVLAVRRGATVMDIVMIDTGSPWFTDGAYMVSESDPRTVRSDSFQTYLLGVVGGLAYSDRYLFASQPEINKVVALDLTDGNIVEEIVVGAGPTLAHQSTELDRIIVANQGDQSIGLIDAVTRQLVATSDVDSQIAQFTFADSSNRFYAVLRNGTIQGVSATDGLVTDAMAFVQPAIGVAMNQQRNELYVVLSGGNGTDIAVVDALTMEQLKTVHLPDITTSIAHYTSRSYRLPAPQGIPARQIPVNGAIWLCLLLVLASVIGLRTLRSRQALRD